MVRSNLTEDHRKALLWLVPGQVCWDAPVHIQGALKSLHECHPDLLHVGYKMTRERLSDAYTLTAQGLTERAALLSLSDCG